MEEYLKQFNFENDEQKEIKIQEFIQKLNNDDLEINEYILKILMNETRIINNSEKIEYYAPESIEEASIIVNDLLYLLGSVPSFITFMEIEANNN